MLLADPRLQPRHPRPPPQLTPAPPGAAHDQTISGATRSRRAHKPLKTSKNAHTRPPTSPPPAPAPRPKTNHRDFVGSARGAWTARHMLARLVWFPPAATSNRACGSPAHGSPTFFTAGIRLSPSPGPVGPWRDDGSREADQPQAIWRAVGDQPPAVCSRPLVAFGHEQREPVMRVVLDQVEVAS